MARGGKDYAGRAGALLAPGDRDLLDAAGGVRSGAAPDRRAGRLDPGTDGPRSAGARPLHPEPPGPDAGGGAGRPDGVGAAASAGRQYRPEAGWPGRMADRETWHKAAE